MNKHIDTYELHRSGRVIKYTVRIRTTMKDEVDIDVLRISINKAIKRYPYFRKQIILEKDGGYNLIDNDREIVVIKTRDALPFLGSDEVNKHLFYVDCEGRDINFNISHSLAGGRGFAPLVETCLYQYVTDKYKVHIDVPCIRKTESDLLENEDCTIDTDRFNLDNKLKLRNKRPGYLLIWPYIKSFLNPFSQNSQYYILSFDSKDIMKYAKGNDSSVASAYMVFIFKAFCRVLPMFAKNITCSISHNPLDQFDYPNNHSNLLTNLNIRYKRKMENYDNELLGTITRSQVYLQSDPSYCCIELMKKIKHNNEQDKKKNIITKKLYQQTICSPLLDGGGTFMLNYTGKRDFGQLANYIESYVYIVDGHAMSEITSMSDKLFMCFLQMNKNPKYINAIKQVLSENDIPFTIKGPFKTNHVRVKLPGIFSNFTD